MKSTLSAKIVAEFIGTFALVLFGTGAAVLAGHDTAAGLSGLGLLGISLAFGLSLVALCYAIGNISGCHVNPAVTIGMLVAGRIKAADAVAYIIAQLIGAALASFVLMSILKGMPGFEMGEWALGSNGWGEGYQNGFNTSSAFLTEAVFTFLFLFIIIGATSKWGNTTMAGLAIGLALALTNLAAIPVTGASVNPARSFGPAIFAGGKALSQLWLFLVAPVAGAIIAALVWKALGKKSE
jgi:aquaporin Z